jgi:hypothetical protein
MKLACLAILNLHAEDSADMYRIEIGPGEETVLRTLEELATAIRNGLVTTRSRIYHNASQKWLPIEFHPHYKKALALPERPKSAPTISPMPGPVPDFAMKREAARAPEPPAPAAPKPEPIAAQARQPRPSRPSIPLPTAAENLPYINVEEPPVEEPKVEAPKVEAPPPEPMPAPVAVAPVLPDPVALEPALAVDAFPSMVQPAMVQPPMVQPRSYLPPELVEREPTHEHAREPKPIAEPDPVPSLSPLPVASRRPSGGSRPMLAGAGALAAVFVGYLFVTSSRPSSDVAAEAAPATEQSQPKSSSADDQELPPEDTDIPAPKPSAVTKALPRSGPPSQAWSSSAGATAPLLPTGPARPWAAAAAETAPDPAIAPPPVSVELSVPKLPTPDSLAPKAQRDTAALKRILKAVGGQ